MYLRDLFIVEIDWCLNLWNVINIIFYLKWIKTNLSLNVHFHQKHRTIFKSWKIFMFYTRCVWILWITIQRHFIAYSQVVLLLFGTMPYKTENSWPGDIDLQLIFGYEHSKCIAIQYYLLYPKQLEYYIYCCLLIRVPTHAHFKQLNKGSLWSRDTTSIDIIWLCYYNVLRIEQRIYTAANGQPYI